MKTGTERNKGTEGLLKAALALCVLFSLAHLVGYIYSHVPPYSEGRCLDTPNQFMKLIVIRNDVLGGYSEVELHMFGDRQRGPVSFDELREPGIKPGDCPND